MLWFSLMGIVEEGRHVKVNETEYRPWGFYEVLSDEEDHKVKRITVEPGRRLSLQRHKQRKEHWFVVSGESLVTIDGKDTKAVSGQAVDIPQGALHRVENKGKEKLVYIEVQLGSYFGEDDIERVEDDYGRV
jgi:mannose-6-phosphate isomerase